MPRTKTPVPANENESQRFVRLANVRTNMVLTNLKSLGQLRGPNYKSTPEQLKKIQGAITESLTRTIQALNTGEANSDFKL
jgi:hypothetical protein